MIATPNPEITGSTGATDNAILRADGTGGSAAQTSGLVVDDAVVSYNVTGDAATDVITAVGHIYTTNQPVVFTALTGGAGLAANTLYFARNISGNTFQVSTTSGGAAVNFTTNITAGSIIAIQANVAISQNTSATDSSLVLTPKGTGAFILGPKPDGTTVGGNARGARAVDFCLERTHQVYVASGNYSANIGGRTNAAQGSESGVFCGNTNTATQNGSVTIGGNNNATGSTSGGIFCGTTNSTNGSESVVLGGRSNQTTGDFSATTGGWMALANRFSMQAHASGAFAIRGDAQRAKFVMRNKSTTNSPVELFLNSADNTRLTIPSGKIIALTINIAGVSSTGAAVAHYMRQYCVKNVALTSTEVYAPIVIGTDNAAGTSIALSVSDPLDALIVSVTGTASTIWRWVASVDAVEIAYGT